MVAGRRDRRALGAVGTQRVRRGGGAWGTGSGLVAAGAYAVAPIRLDPAYWHGLGTALAMVFVPLVVMSLALLFRGARGRRHVLLLAVALLGVATAHSTSTIVVAMLLGTAVLVDLAVTLVAARRDPGEAPRRWWREGIVRPLGAAVAVACVLGAGILAHLALQADALGAPVNYRFLDPGWLDRASLEHYYGAAFLVVSVVAVALVLSSSGCAGRALLAVASLVLACVVVSQVWRVHVSFDYQRVVYYVGVALVLLIGAAFSRRSPRASGSRLRPGDRRRGAGVRRPPAAGARRARGAARPRGVRSPGVQGARRQRAARRAHRQRRVPALRDAVPPAEADAPRVRRASGRLRRQAAARAAGRGDPRRRHRGGRAGGTARRAVAVADPECVPDLAETLGGTTIAVANDGVVVVRLPERG